MEPYYKGIWIENECGQDGDYEDFKEPGHKSHNES
jgi:hypothetical protein